VEAPACVSVNVRQKDRKAFGLLTAQSGRLAVSLNGR
jgi:hypothetical protein